MDDSDPIATLHDHDERIEKLERELTLLKKKSLTPDEAAEFLGLPKKGT